MCVYIIYYKKNDLKMVAATIKKIQAPNQLAATFDVSGSPDENLLYTFTPPISPQTAPTAYTSFVSSRSAPLLGLSPLRTVHESFPSHGSSNALPFLLKE